MDFEKTVINLSKNLRINNNTSKGIFIDILNKDLNYCTYLQNKYSNCQIKKQDILSIVFYFEILEYLHNKIFDLALNKEENEANYYLTFLEITSDCFYKIFDLLQIYEKEYQNDIKKKFYSLKQKYVKELNPLNLLVNNDIDKLLNQDINTINKLKDRYNELIYKYIDNLLEEL